MTQQAEDQDQDWTSITSTNNDKKWKVSTDSDNLTSIKTGGSSKSKMYEIDELESQELILQNQNPNNSYFSSAIETVFSIDHIVDLILLECEDRSTLLNCRQLSRRWADFVTKALHKTVNIIFVTHTNQGSPQMLKTRCGRTVEDLIAVMNHSTDIDFPSTSFTFFDVDHSSSANQNRRLDRFLDTHGHSIKKLKLRGFLNLYELKRLLLIQAPNLEILSMQRLNVLKWTEEQRGGPDDDLKERGESPEDRLTRRISLFYPDKVGCPEPILKNLKVLKSSTGLCECIPEICIQQILKCSPNLVQVVIPEEYLHNLVRPVNRVELFKVLIMHCRNQGLEQLSIIANNHAGHLRLRKILFSGTWEPCLNENLYSKSGGILTKILNGSAASCQILNMHKFLTHFEIPRMPAVTDFSFTCWIVDEGRLVHVFERGVNLRDIFPNLKSLNITLENYEGQDISVGSFFGVRNEMIVPAPSVNKVSLGYFEVDQNLLDGFKTMFPSALFNIGVTKWWQ